MKLQIRPMEPRAMYELDAGRYVLADAGVLYRVYHLPRQGGWFWFSAGYKFGPFGGLLSCYRNIIEHLARLPEPFEED